MQLGAELLASHGNQTADGGCGVEALLSSAAVAYWQERVECVLAHTELDYICDRCMLVHSVDFEGVSQEHGQCDSRGAW